MPVIFKEKNYNKIVIYSKKIIIIIFLFLVLILAVNNYLSSQITKLEAEIKILEEEELKYEHLIRELIVLENKKDELNSFEILKELALKADNIFYNSIQMLDNKIHLKAKSEKRSSIYNFYEDITADENYQNISLNYIKKNIDYQFELEAVLAAF